MSDVLLSLITPDDVAQHIEDLLLSRPDLVRGFTSGRVNGHGVAIQLVEAAELVSGHSPRVQIQAVGAESEMRAVLALIKQALPRANVFYWLLPVMAMGRL